MVIIRLTYPPPRESSIFEFPIEDSGTIARSGRLLSPTNETSDFWNSKEYLMTVARIKALEWCYWQAAIESDHAIGGPQVNGRPKPRVRPPQVSTSKPKTEEAPRESEPEDTPPSQVQQTALPKSAKQPREPKNIQIGKEVKSLIPHCLEGLTLLRKAMAEYPAAEHIWKSKLLQARFSEKEFDILTRSRKPESAACQIVAQKHPEMKLKTVRNHYSTFKHS